MKDDLDRTFDPSVSNGEIVKALRYFVRDEKGQLQDAPRERSFPRGLRGLELAAQGGSRRKTRKAMRQGGSEALATVRLSTLCAFGASVLLALIPLLTSLVDPRIALEGDLLNYAALVLIALVVRFLVGFTVVRDARLRQRQARLLLQDGRLRELLKRVTQDPQSSESAEAQAHQLMEEELLRRGAALTAEGWSLRGH